MRSESLNGSNWKRSFVSMLCMCSYWLTDETHTGLETRVKARFRMLLENTLAKKLMNYRWLGWDLRVFKSFGFDEIRIPPAECRMPKRLPLELFRDSRSHLNLYYASDVSSLHRDRDASANRCLSLHVGNFSWLCPPCLWSCKYLVWIVMDRQIGCAILATRLFNTRISRTRLKDTIICRLTLVWAVIWLHNTARREPS